MFLTRLKASVWTLCAACLWAPAQAVELCAEKADTFISEKIPGGEFSDLPYLALSYREGNAAIAYIPFLLRATDHGMNAPFKIVDAQLELSAMAIPDLEKIADEGEAEELALIKFEIYAITDAEHFDPLENRLKVSWNGENEHPAPKHDTVSARLDRSGTAFLGEVHVSLKDGLFLESRKIIFKEESLKNFIAFACGSPNKDATLHADSPLPKIERAVFILKQISGAEGLLICSANYEMSESEEKEIAKERAEEADEGKGEEKKAENLEADEKEKVTEEDIKERDSQLKRRPRLEFEFQNEPSA